MFKYWLWGCKDTFPQPAMHAQCPAHPPCRRATMSRKGSVPSSNFSGPCTRLGGGRSSAAGVPGGQAARAAASCVMLKRGQELNPT